MKQDIFEILDDLIAGLYDTNASASYDVEKKENGDIVLKKKQTLKDSKEFQTFNARVKNIDDEILKTSVRAMKDLYPKEHELLVSLKGSDVDLFNDAVKKFDEVLKQVVENKIESIEDEIDDLYEEINDLKDTYLNK